MMRLLLAAWALACPVAVGPATAAERHALLVGVSSVPALPRNAGLEGPRYDVPAMRNALLAQGFQAASIVSLADGAAAPTRSAVLAQLALLTKTLHPGDVLVIYWSGHGVLMPAHAASDAMQPGQQVHLLTQDSRIDPQTRQLAGGMGSAEIGLAIDALAARQVQVVAVFDSCHAAGSTRGDAGLVWRGLAMTDLGGRTSIAQPAGRIAEHLSDTGSLARERPNFVGFFAAEPQQRSAEALRSEHAGQARGLFTRALITALQDGPASYLAWANFASQYYKSDLDASQLPATARPSPVYAGALEQTLWSDAKASAIWPVRRDERGWYLPYGLLDGVRPGDQFQRGAARWRVDQLDWGEARLQASSEDVAAGGWARRLPGSQPDLRLITQPVRRSKAEKAGKVTVSLPGQAAAVLRVADSDLPALHARVAGIAALLALPSTAAAAPPLQARIELKPPGQTAISLPFTDRDLGLLAPGTRLRMIVENAGDGAVDVSIAHLPLSGPSMRVFPAFAADSNRLAPSTPRHISRIEREFEVTGQGVATGAPEWLALVAAPAPNGAMPRPFALDGMGRPGVEGGERGAAAGFAHNSNQAQVARLSWRVAPAATP